MIRSHSAVRAHPAVKDLLATRAFIVRTLTKVGLNYEPTRASAGRPAKGFGWQGPA